MSRFNSRVGYQYLAGEWFLLASAESISYGFAGYEEASTGIGHMSAAKPTEEFVHRSPEARRIHSSAQVRENWPVRGKKNCIFCVARRNELNGIARCAVHLGSRSDTRREGVHGNGEGVRFQVVGKEGPVSRGMLDWVRVPTTSSLLEEEVP